jgi:hypothetical protein
MVATSLGRNNPLLTDFCNHSCADGPATFTNSELQPIIHGDRCDQLDFYVNVIARHNHFSAFRQLNDSRHVRRAEKELGPITIEKKAYAGRLPLWSERKLQR